MFIKHHRDGALAKGRGRVGVESLCRRFALCEGAAEHSRRCCARWSVGHLQRRALAAARSAEHLNVCHVSAPYSALGRGGRGRRLWGRSGRLCRCLPLPPRATERRRSIAKPFWALKACSLVRAFTSPFLFLPLRPRIGTPGSQRWRRRGVHARCVVPRAARVVSAAWGCFCRASHQVMALS